MARVIGIFPRQDQVGSLVDTLKNEGIPRDALIISARKNQATGGGETDPEELAWIESEAEGIDQFQPYAEIMEDEFHREGIVVAAEVPEKQAARLMQLMEEAGAMEIKKD